MSDESLAIKYRPKKLTDVIGQKVVTQALTNAFKNDNLHHSYIFGGKFGCGKCVTGETIVSTSRGFARISDLVPNSQSISRIDLSVPDESGLGLSEYGYFEPDSQVIYIETSDGFSITGTPEHRIRTIDRYGCLTWKRLSDIDNKDYIAISRKPTLGEFKCDNLKYSFDKEQYSLRHEKLANRQNCLKSLHGLDIDVEISENIAMLFGAILSKGACCSSNLVITNTCKSLIDICSNALNELGISHSEYSDVRKEKIQHVIHCNSAGSKQLFSDLGFDVKSNQKYVPGFMLGFPKSKAAYWLKSYFEGDGGVEEGSVKAWSTSRRLLSDIQTILLGFGIVSRIRQMNKTCSNCIRQDSHIAYELSIDCLSLDLFAENIGFISDRKSLLLEKLCKKQNNPNKSIIPYWQDIVLKMKKRIPVKKNGYIGKHRAPRWNSNISEKAISHKNLTLDNIRQVAQYFNKVSFLVEDSDLIRDLRTTSNELENLLAADLYFSPVSKAQPAGSQDVYDLAKMSNDHSFYANGFINHNTTTARILAAMLNDPSGPTLEPDLSNPIVQSIFKGESIDVKELDAASNRGVDDIRALSKESRYAPVECNYKVFIIDEAHSLTGYAAEAMLKLIEEPPNKVLFIFCTTEPQSLKPTILSRSISFKFHKVSWNEIAQHLRSVSDKEGLIVEEDALKICARTCDGSVRNALQNLQTLINFCSGDITVDAAKEVLGSVEEKLFFDLVDCICSVNTPKGMQVIDSMLMDGKRAVEVVNGLYHHLRNLMIARSCGNDLANFGFSEDEVKRLNHQGSEVGLELIIEMMSLLVDVNRGLTLNLDIQILLEKFMIQSIITNKRLIAKKSK